MSRDNGFAIADIDTGFFADPKVVRLARRLNDPQATAVHLMLYKALVLGSWGAGERITLEDAMPAWFLAAPDGVLDNLVAVEMVDPDGRVPEHAWRSYFEPAWARREERRKKAQKGGLASRKPTPSQLGDGFGSASSGLGDNPTDRPTDKTVPFRSVRSLQADVIAPAGAIERDSDVV